MRLRLLVCELVGEDGEVLGLHKVSGGGRAGYSLVLVLLVALLLLAARKEGHSQNRSRLPG